jgi:glucose/arabinose dehydrogenase/PKD repeat protein
VLSTLRRFAPVALAALAAAGCASGATDPATDVTDRAATLRAHGSAGGKPTTYWFEYGTSTSYGTSTPRRDGGSGTSQRNVSERVTGLTPDTLYYYRACASNADGSGCTGPATFRTGSVGMLPGFQETVVYGGLTNPTAVRFSPDGRVFVAEKSGLIRVYDGLEDTTPTTFADLRTKVHNFWDRGLLGMALHPDFPAKPFVYVSYTHDAVIGGTAPRWGTAGQTSDPCPTPPGPTGDGCLVSGRLSRLQAIGNGAGPEQVLIEDWCQQFPSHSVGDIEFGADGALYASGGEGASFTFTDRGQIGNPCDDPADQGGALRAQDLRTTGDKVGLDGTVIRVDPETGQGLPDNPRPNDPDPDGRRIVAYGLRNPFRLTIRPGTSEPWIGDVGWDTVEEINRQPKPPGWLENFGWPCYEGGTRQGGYDALDVSLCESLYPTSYWRGPYFSYRHDQHVFSEETCPVGSSSISGLAFTPPDSPLPAEFTGALFIADYSRNCIWVMPRGSNGLPSSALVKTFRAGASGPVELQFGPGGDLFYPAFGAGQIRRIHYTAGNQPPRAVVSASPTSGPTPLDVDFSATSSSDPDPGDTLTYEWDLDGDGAFDDGGGATAEFSYAAAGTYLAAVRVTDNHGAVAVDAVAIRAGNTAPTATITSPSAGLTWKVGDSIAFAGGASDPDQGSLPGSSLDWTLVMHHCPSNCHEHVVQSFPGVASGSFVAPDHEYPSYLELRLTATDSGGLTAAQSILLEPKTAVLSFASSPSGLTLTVNGSSSTTPFSRTVILGSVNGIVAPTPQTLASATYDFSAWSDGGARAHNITASSDRSLTATFTQR